MKKIIIFIFILFCIGIMPKFLRFMETQNDILQISKQEQQVFMITRESIDLSKIKDIKIGVEPPQEIKDRMETQRKEDLLKKQEEEKQKELAKLKAEKKKTAQTLITSRSETTERNVDGYTAFTATGYCPCASCCGKTTGITASGVKAVAGITVAMPPRFSFGTQIEIQGRGIYTVQDRGGAIQGNKIDIFFNTHQEALNFGRRTVYLKVL